MAKRFSMIFGSMFVLVGLLGFIPNTLIGETGFFATNGPHDWTHILIGAVMIWASTQSERAAYVSLMGFGMVYALLALMGYATAGSEGHTMLLGVVHINGNDNWLHVLLAVLLIGSGLASRRHIGTTHHPAHQH